MKLSQAEFDTLLQLWEYGEPIRPATLLQKMYPIHPWTISTLKTLLTRLEEKGYVKITLQKRFFYYEPKYTKEEFLVRETGMLMEKLNDFSPLPLMVELIKSKDLTKEELDRLEALIQNEKAHVSKG